VLPTEGIRARGSRQRFAAGAKPYRFWEVFMQLNEMIAAHNVWARLKVSGKEHVLRELSRRASTLVPVDETAIYAALVDRETLGSTGIGHGIALPHARLPGLKHSIGIVATLQRAIDFHSIDDEPVDIIGLLLLPNDEKADANVALACLARRLRESAVADRLRASKSDEALYGALCGT
jgi:PTS system nitrogen regulatory IIA component